LNGREENHRGTEKKRIPRRYTVRGSAHRRSRVRRDQIVNLLTRHRDQIAAFGVRRLALFGSVARETARPKSDVDLLVEFEGAPTFDRYVDLSFFLEDLLRRPVDLVTAASLRGPLRAAVEQDAIDVPGLSPLSQ